MRMVPTACTDAFFVALWSRPELYLLTPVPRPLEPLDLRLGSNPYGLRMSTYTVGEVADRSGFSTSSLRYYEGIGLVAPATRTESGYRVYDDQTLAQTLARLA